MEIRIRITLMRVIVGGLIAFLVTSTLLLRLAVPGPNAVIGCRNSLRARLAIPEDLREFPVEQYVERTDWFVYRYAAYPSGSCHWRLRIVCAAGEAEKWRREFRRYLQTRGKCIERGGDATIASQERIFFLRQDSGGSAFVWMGSLSDRLQITFEYRKARRRSRIWRTRFGRYLAAVLLKVGLPVDAITSPS